VKKDAKLKIILVKYKTLIWQTSSNGTAIASFPTYTISVKKPISPVLKKRFLIHINLFTPFYRDYFWADPQTGEKVIPRGNVFKQLSIKLINR